MPNISSKKGLKTAINDKKVVGNSSWHHGFPLLSHMNKKLKLQRAQAHQNWTEEDCNHCLVAKKSVFLQHHADWWRSDHWDLHRSRELSGWNIDFVPLLSFPCIEALLATSLGRNLQPAPSPWMEMCRSSPQSKWAGFCWAGKNCEGELNQS